MNGASFVDIPFLFPPIPCAWHSHGPHLAGEGEKGLVGNGRAIKHGSTWRETAISILLILSAHQGHAEFIWKTKF